MRVTLYPSAIARVSAQQDLEKRLAASLTRSRAHGGLAAGLCVAAALLVAACAVWSLSSPGAGAAIAMAGRAALRDTFGPRHTFVAIDSPVQVEIGTARLAPPAALAMVSTSALTLPISFGQPVAPEDEVTPRAHHWHRRLVHHRYGTYFLPAPGAPADMGAQGETITGQTPAP